MANDTTNYSSTTSNGENIYRRSSSNSTGTLPGFKMSELETTRELHDDDILILSRSTDGGANYQDTYKIKLSDTNIINSLDSGAYKY